MITPAPLTLQARLLARGASPPALVAETHEITINCSGRSIAKGIGVAWVAEGLNPAQREAVEHGAGPLLVIAGPGSGKTRVITHRIAHLIKHHHVPAHHLLAITFTNKAAQEMRRRVTELLPDQRVETSTFHSFCARLLRRHASRIGRTNAFTILDRSDRRKLLGEILRAKGIDAVHDPVEGFDRAISNAKNELATPDKWKERVKDRFHEMVADVYSLYEERLRALDAFDFDDLLMSTATMLDQHEDLRAALDRQYQYVLIDEYQDTNIAQYAIARALSVNERNLCVSGDPDQSIYGWRGANIENILRFDVDFPDAKIVRLEMNYRSDGHILAVADSLIRHNARRADKELLSHRGMGKPVVVLGHKDDAAEARGIAQHILRAVHEEGRDFNDFAVLARTVSVVRSIEPVLRAAHIPYRLVGGDSFLEMAEILDLVAYGRLLVNPRDDRALRRVINTPARGIGATTIARLEQHASAQGIPCREALRTIGAEQGVKGKSLQRLRAVADLFDSMSDLLEMSPSTALRALLDRTGYATYLDEMEAKERDRRWANLEDAFHAAEQFSFEYPELKLAGFLDALSLSSDADRPDDSGQNVSVMTLHAAKGLEFPVVFLVGFEEGFIPHERAVEEGNEEEERRLAFVGMTRAREELYLCHTMKRVIHGRTSHNAPSSFLFELAPHSVERRDLVLPAPARPLGPIHSDDVSQENHYEEPCINVRLNPRELSESDRFHAGMTVRHPDHGDGLIELTEGVGDKKMATINFPKVGRRRFVLCEADLDLVDQTAPF